MGTRARRFIVAATLAGFARGAIFAQPDFNLAPSDPEQELLEQIAQLRAGGGPTPAGLIEPLQTLAFQYQETGDHALAIVALEEARHVTRVHEGLTSADEALLLRQQIRSEEALGLHQRVWDLEQDMVTIARQHHDDLRMLPIFSELAGDRSDALEEYRSGGFPPEIELGCYYVPWDPRPYRDTRGKVRPPPELEGTSCRSGQSSSVVGRLRAEILTYYADAIEVILKNGDYASRQLRDLEKQALRVATRPRFNRSCEDRPLNELLALPLLGSCLEPVIHRFGEPVGGNVGGWVSLVRLISYEIRSGAPAAARANAIAELADWHLVSTPPDRRRFEEFGRVFRFYERAHRELEQEDEARASIFSPEVPITLPTHDPNPFASATAAASSRYIDVSFEITKDGRGKKIELLDTSRDATRAEERDLIRLIEGSTFRPRFVDGELADAAPVVLRYRLGP